MTARQQQKVMTPERYDFQSKRIQPPWDTEVVHFIANFYS